MSAPFGQLLGGDDVKIIETKDMKPAKIMKHGDLMMIYQFELIGTLWCFQLLPNVHPTLHYLADCQKCVS